MKSRTLYGRNSGIGFVRKLAPAAWYRQGIGVTVTGSGVSTWADQSGSGRDFLQGTDANRPIYLPYTGTRYGYLPGVSGNYWSTGNASANRITGDFAVVVRCALNSYTLAGQALASKYAAGNQAWIFGPANDGSGKLQLYNSRDGSSNEIDASSAANPFSAGDECYLAVSRVAASGDIKFWTSSDGVTFTQLGTTQSSTAGGLYAATTPFEVGGIGGGTPIINAPTGKVYSVSLYNGIPPILGGTDSATPSQQYSASDWSETSTNGATQVSSTTGETWTLNNTGAKPAQIVGSPILLGDGTAHKMATSGFTANQPRTGYMLVYPRTWTAADYLCSGVAAEAGVTQVTGTPKVGLNAGSGAAENAGLVLGAWNVLAYVINGASSLTQVNLGTPVTGDAGANNPGGLALFSNQAGTGYFNGMLKEWVEFPVAHDASQRARVIGYLAGVGGVSL